MGKGLKLKGGLVGDKLKNVPESAYMVAAAQDWAADRKGLLRNDLGRLPHVPDRI